VREATVLGHTIGSVELVKAPQFIVVAV
jgi:hypothetical protein